MKEIKTYFSKLNCLFIYTLLTVFVSIFSIGNTWGQSSDKLDAQVEQAKKLYLGNNFDRAAQISSEILKTAPDNYMAHRILAEIYKSRDDVDKQILHFEKAIQNGTDSTMFFSLGEAYYEKHNFSESFKNYKKYSSYQYIPEKSRFLLACKMANCYFLLNGIHDLSQANASVSDQIVGLTYWPVISADGKKLNFRDPSNPDVQPPKVSLIAVSEDSLNGSQLLPEQLKAETSIEQAEKKSGSAQIVFFTGRDREDGLGDCDIYYSRFSEGRWTEPKNAGNSVNTSSWDAHPFFSIEENYLYFSSNRTGGEGNKDIWRSRFLGFKSTGEINWGPAENLGRIINTEGNEISPFVYWKNKSMYFASDLHAGMGGLDLFSVELTSTKNVKNLGYPVNTINNEYGAFIHDILDSAYVAVGRQVNNQNVIMAYNQVRGMNTPVQSYVNITVVDAKSGKPVLAEVELLTWPGTAKNAEKYELSKRGKVMVSLPLYRKHILNITKPGHLFYSTELTFSEQRPIKDPFVLNVRLKPIQVGAEIDLYNIYFEINAFTILPESETELQKLVLFMQNNTKVKVEIQGHTDNTGDPGNNLDLSNKRAKSIVDYLLKNGITAGRLRFAGYGDKQPVASNDTEEGRQLNRRTTVKIIEAD